MPEEKGELLLENEEVKELVSGCRHLFSGETTYVNDQAAEYVVQSVKHFFDKVVVVQYCVTNTLEDQVLSEVRLLITGVDSAYHLKLLKVCNLAADARIKYGQTSYAYAVFTKEECAHPFPLAKISQKLQVKITEIDVDSQEEIGSYEEDYNLEESSIAVRDYMKAGQGIGLFKDAWETIGASGAEVI